MKNIEEIIFEINRLLKERWTQLRGIYENPHLEKPIALPDTCPTCKVNIKVFLRDCISIARKIFEEQQDLINDISQKRENDIKYYRDRLNRFYSENHPYKIRNVYGSDKDGIRYNLMIKESFGDNNGICVEVDITNITEIDKLCSALKFYANKENWEWQDTPAGEDQYIPCRHDEGDIAREALGIKEE